MDAYVSALTILPEAFRLIGRRPLTVLDFGCGDGSWLRAAATLGVFGAVGCDVREPGAVKLPRTARYIQKDLLRDPGGLVEAEAFDLVVCVEVAEHIPFDLSGRLVEILTGNTRGPVLFSAAPPGQGPYPPPGTPVEESWPWHVNEQEPGFWEALFQARGFFPDDRIGDRIKYAPLIDPWYRTNVRMFFRGEEP